MPEAGIVYFDSFDKSTLTFESFISICHGSDGMCNVFFQ